MKLSWLITAMTALMGLAAIAAPAPSPWEQPAAALADQISGILGPGQARLTIRNLSSISTDDIPAIRQLLEQDLRARGVTASGAESANTVRVTLSESAHDRLWVAEVVEGDQTQVAVVDLGPNQPQQPQSAGGIMLRKDVLLSASKPLLAALELPDTLIALEPEQIVIYAHAKDGWREQQRVTIAQKRPLSRDPRGILLLTRVAPWNALHRHSPGRGTRRLENSLSRKRRSLGGHLAGHATIGTFDAQFTPRNHHGRCPRHSHPRLL